MDVDSFLGGLAVKPVAATTERSTASEGAVPEREKALGNGAITGDSPLPPSDLTKDITPSGIEVAYQSRPKRLYRVNGVEVPSVTTVLDVLAKGGLTIWGMRVGIQGVLTLFERGHLTTELDWETERERVAVSAGHPASLELVEGLLKIEGLTTNALKESGGERGNIVHDSLEAWAKTGHIPVATDFEEREFGYIEGLAKFLVDADPEPVRTEVMVGSVEYGYAGRYDIEIRLNETRRIRKTPKQKWQEVGPGVFLVDGKSAKGVYPGTNFRQLAAYEAARVECGYPATDGQYVLNVNGEGSYAFVRSTAVLKDFLAVLSVYGSDKRMAA